MSELPNAIAEAELNICGITLKVVQLDNGQRVIAAESMEAFFEAMCSGATLTFAETEELRQILRLPPPELGGEE